MLFVHCDVAARVKNYEGKISLASRETCDSFRFELAVERLRFAKRWRGRVPVPFPEFEVSFLAVSCCSGDYDESFATLVKFYTPDPEPASGSRIALPSSTFKLS